MGSRISSSAKENAGARAWGAALAGLAVVLAAAVNAEAQRRAQPLPEGVSEKSVSIWSEGVKLAGDLYYPSSMKDGDALPAVVLCSGWGGTKRGNRRIGTKLAADGYITLSFDYRGWGASQSKLVIQGEMPERDEKNIITVKAEATREVVDPIDEARDIWNAINFLMGEPGVDTDRIGLWGTSYGGGLVTWTAGHDKRVKCIVAQVPGMGAQSEAGRKFGERRAMEIARGDIEPIPQGTDLVEGLRGTPNRAKMTLYNAVEASKNIDIPTLIIDAENEELMNRLDHGKAVYEIIKAKGNVPVKYHVVEGIGHYGIYREAYEVSSDMALAWFNEHLK